MKLRLVVMVLVGASVAHAAPKSEDQDRRAAAAALFQQGLQLMESGKTAEGCDKLAESIATLPDSGAKGALAECDTTLGRLSEAWDLWHDLAVTAPTAELRADAANNAAALDRRLTRVVLRVRGVAPSDLVVTLNDKPVRADSATEHRVVPGTLVVVAESPEIERWTRTLSAKAGATLEVDIRAEVSHSLVHRRHTGRLIGLSLAGVGALSIGVGAVFGGLAFSDSRSATSSCGGDTAHCKSSGYVSAQSDLSSARRSATISSWAVGGGLTVAATGMILYLVFRDPRPTESAAWHAAPMTDAQTVGLVLTRSLP
jgi:hypothetical protein